MIRGIPIEEFPNFNLKEYKNINDVENIIQYFFMQLQLK
jgi:hypothetical protein